LAKLGVSMNIPDKDIWMIMIGGYNIAVIIDMTIFQEIDYAFTLILWSLCMFLLFAGFITADPYRVTKIR